MTAQPSTRYSIYRDDSINEYQAQILFELENAVQSYASALSSIASSATRDRDSLRTGSRPWGLSHQTLMEAGQHAAKMDALITACKAMRISRETIQTVVTQAGA